MHVSLDGYIGKLNGDMDWVTMNDDAMGKFLIGDLLSTVDTMLLGRGLYEGFHHSWPSMARHPSTPKDLEEFAHWIENTPKFVFSKKLRQVDWKNSILIKKDIAAEVVKLKQAPGGDMVLFGGAGIVATFTELGLIDEYRLKLEPVVLGCGKPLFKGIKNALALKLTKAKIFDSGVMGVYYQKR